MSLTELEQDIVGLKPCPKCGADLWRGLLLWHHVPEIHCFYAEHLDGTPIFSSRYNIKLKGDADGVA